MKPCVGNSLIYENVGGVIVIKIPEIAPLLSDMGRNKVKQDKFNFKYNNVEFKVVVLIDRTPFQLLFGVVGHNFSFVLKLHIGYELEDMKDEDFYTLCRILNLKPSKESLTSFKFIKFFASKIPKRCNPVRVQPHEIAEYKKRNVPDGDKIYFCGWRLHINDGKNAQNFKKTEEWLGGKVAEFCKENNISSCWTDKSYKRVDYYLPAGYNDVRD